MQVGSLSHMGFSGACGTGTEGRAIQGEDSMNKNAGTNMQDTFGDTAVQLEKRNWVREQG